jgi:DNA polymerase I-like protein with 3'-5' exonuclease and polymerase domains
LTELVLDVENSITFRGNDKFADPYEPTNALVMVGILPVSGDKPTTYTYNHNEYPTPDSPEALQQALNGTTLLIGHNIIHDLVWLRESGFTYDGPVWDTMIAAYLLQKGKGGSGLSLDSVTDEYELEHKKSPFMKEQISLGVNVNEMDYATLCTYLDGDLLATKDAYRVLKKCLVDEKLLDMQVFCCEVALVVADINRNGIAVDLSALEEVRKEFLQEKRGLERDIDTYVKLFMGDLPINLNSSRDKSMLIYSRDIKDRNTWIDSFNVQRMPDAEYKATVREGTSIVKKATVSKCHACHGKGKVYPMTKKGVPRKGGLNCKTCSANGYVYTSTAQTAGMKFFPPDKSWVRQDGFVTDKEALDLLSGVAISKGLVDESAMLDKMKRLNQVEVYLNTFVGGIQRFTKWHTKLLHVNLTQTITATGRFSGRNPNMQNMPRGATFPVKKCFVSRWEGGKIIEADFAQLEFRVAAFLSQDPVAIKEILTGFDVHSYTAKVITESGQPISRQVAKAHTFAPLYGATGFGRTPAEAAYYQQFIKKYEGIGKYHATLATEVLTTRHIALPSGRKYEFPDVYRRQNGDPTGFTKIKNYPVQGFATGDIVPLTLIVFSRLLKEANLQSLLVNSVHDSIVIDAHPDEIDEVLTIVKTISANLNTIIHDRWGIDFNVPLALDSKMGDNWLDTKDV